jgi:spore coat protein A, manganese oxidase
LGQLAGQPLEWYHSPAVRPFIDPLPIPRKMRPHSTRENMIQYRVRMMEFRKPLHSELPPATLWGYEGEVPGPVFEAMRGKPVQVEWQNDLPLRHLFAVDPHLHGCAAPVPAVRTVPHLHGSHTDSLSDGLPEKWFTPGHSAAYRYPNDQEAATLWYHDHAIGITRLNVYAGLSGFYLLRDSRELAMSLPSGDYEVPMVLQDRSVDEGGQLVYRPTFDDGSQAPGGRWGPQFFGDLPLVNGAIYPFFEVEPRQYRLRVLNASNSRFFNLFLNLASTPTDIPRLVKFHQIGSDGGLLPSPASLEHLLLAPAERADLIVDFSGLEGKVVTLSNNAPAPFPGWDVLSSLHAPLLELMQFRVTRPLSSNATVSLPPRLSFPQLDPVQSVRTRDFFLSDQMDAKGRSQKMLINGKGYDAPTTEFPRLGAQETWRFINATDDAHPIHLHLVQFRVLERQGFDGPTLTLRGEVRLLGKPRPPAANEAGWKDTAIVMPGEVLSLLVRFEGFTGKYVYHCHVAEHEDNDMMRPFEVVSADPNHPTRSGK